MRTQERRRAITAALATASSLGLAAEDAIVLQDSDKLSLRLLPADVLARVAPADRQNAAFELELAGRLAQTDSPVGLLEPRVAPGVHERDGFVLTLWTFYASVDRELSPAEYADALHRLHAGMRQVELGAPHFTDRVDEAQRLVASRDRSPGLAERDRELLGNALRDLGRAVSGHSGTEQLLHGEPHPGNVLATKDGPRFIDLETCCRGPVEFDLAHAPEEVAEHYPGLDRGLLRRCRILMLAMITAWRWDREDQLPNGRQLGIEWLDQLRTALAAEPDPTEPEPG